MGSGTYSSNSHAVRAESAGYYTKSTREVFKQKRINNAMDPRGVRIREARDSAEHPNSLAIILGLDVTGSMGSIPHFLVKQGLPNIMDKIIQNGLKDPQVLFLGIGDHMYDSCPLQVSQFESSDELLDHWLTSVFLEGGGGGNDGESYLLAWYFAAKHTSIDCFEKRKQKGFLFTIGDEPPLEKIDGNYLKHIMGDGQYEDLTAFSLLEKVREMYNVFHINVGETASGSRQTVVDAWKQILKDNLLVAKHHDDIASLIADTIIKNTKTEIKEEATEETQGDILL